MIKISVIIPTYNDWTRLLKCLDALCRQSFDTNHFEVIVVDNSNKYEVPDNLLELPLNLQCYYQSIPGSYAARNLGAKNAKGDILAFTDADCIPDQDWLTNAYTCFTGSNYDLIGGNIKIFKPDVGSEYAFIYDKHIAFPQYKNVPSGNSVTANLFVRKVIFEEMDNFDSSMKSGGDWDFTQRCTGRDHNMIYAEDVLVFHPASKNISGIFKKHFRLTCWGSINTRKKHGHSQLRILCSHLLRGLKTVKEHQLMELKLKERLIIFSIDLVDYVFKVFVHFGILIRLINPNKVRD